MAGLLRLSPCLVLAAAAELAGASTIAATGEPPEILVSRQLLEAERLTVGDVVQLSTDSSGSKPRAFRITGVYEPMNDPQRLGERRLEVRLHLPDLIDLTRDPSDPASAEAVGAINVALADPGDAARFARDLGARMPGLVARPTSPRGEAVDPFVVLDRFHLAIAIVTVVASSIFLLALMVMLVDERRETVAVLRLIGLRRRRILLQVFTEGLLIATAGALFGVLLAVVLEGGLNRFFQWHYDTALVFVQVTPRIAWRSVTIAVPLGMLAAVASSWGLLRQGVMSLARR
jgi:putative ABC transport system permease protein